MNTKTNTFYGPIFFGIQQTVEREDSENGNHFEYPRELPDIDALPLSAFYEIKIASVPRTFLYPACVWGVQSGGGEPGTNIMLVYSLS